MGVEAGAAKPTMKEALYACCFGMSRAKLRALVADGSRTNSGLGAGAADAFMGHALIRELLDGRGRAMKKVAEEGGVRDAWGRWYAAKSWGEIRGEKAAKEAGGTLEEPPGEKRYAHHALLALQAQSWELRLMLPLFEVAEETPHVMALSWLHDGMVAWCSDRRPGRMEGFVRAARTAFDSGALELGFPTDLEVDFL